MSETIALIDYGSGNLRSAENALRRAADRLPRRPEIRLAAHAEEIARADRIVLPGVGAFSACASALAERGGFIEAMSEAALARGAPFFGICVGMQLMAERGLEFGEHAGLGWIAGDVVRLSPVGPGRKVPHVGWNTVAFTTAAAWRDGLADEIDMYFTHSYAFRPAHEADIGAWTDHGGRFVSAVTRGNLAGVQFHPEKSQSAGVALLAGFLAWRP